MAVRAFGKMTQIQKRIFIKGFPLFTWWKLLFFFKDTSKYDPSTCILQNLHLSHKSCVCVRILAGFFLKIYTFVLFSLMSYLETIWCVIDENSFSVIRKKLNKELEHIQILSVANISWLTFCNLLMGFSCVLKSKKKSIHFPIQNSLFNHSFQ